MDESAVYLQPAFILQQRPYRESSALLEVFTCDYGLLTILAKGVRKPKSKLAGILQPFGLLRLSYLNKHELKVLTQTELAAGYPLQGLGLYCAFYVNELLQRFLHKHDPHPQLFDCYRTCLEGLLDKGRVEQTLRYFELDLLEEAGYGIRTDIVMADEHPGAGGQRYGFQPDAGLVEDGEGPFSAEMLCALFARQPLQGQALAEAKKLMRQMLDEHLQGRPLKSREVLAKMMKYL